MASGPGEIMEHREEVADDDEPLWTDDRSIQDKNGTLYTNITDVGAEIVGIEGHHDVEVAVFSDHIRIRPPTE